MAGPGWEVALRPFADGRFHTADGRACMVAVTPRAPVGSPGADYLLVLNTGRVRDQWHTMTRTGRSLRLASHSPEPFVEIHSDDAGDGIEDGGLARLTSRWGSALLRVRIEPGLRPGAVFVPMHWDHQFASRARIGALVNPVVDPISGEPQLKHTPVRVEPYETRWYGFLLSRRRLKVGSLARCWAVSRGIGL